MIKQPKTLGFIGIGLMGKPLTLRLLKAGYKVNVWNRTVNKLNEVIEAGAIACSSIAEITQQSDIVILCLADTPIVEAIVFQENGIAANGDADKLLIDLSSTHPENTRDYAKKLLEHCGMYWIDAPVSGGVAGAEQGSLAIMVGGDDETISIAREVLKPLYSQFTHMGEVGSGQITKVCNQMIVSCNVLVIAEMVALAQQAGVDASKIPQALAGGFADSKPLQIVAPEMAQQQFEPIKWRVQTLLKDLNMAVDISKKQGNAIPMSALAAQLMQLHGSQGHLQQDPATLIKLYQK